ncbi:MAG: hypothetical protein U0Z70_07025 [Thermomicrobiales bacterium]|jgi:hypothetical protein
MPAPRNQVTCRACGAVMGRFVRGRPGGGRRAQRNAYQMQPRLDVLPTVALLVFPGSVELFCPHCSHVRRADLHRYAVKRGAA